MKNSLKITALALCGAFMFAGCNANGPQFTKFDTPKDDKSLVYVYRTSGLGAAVTPKIHQTDLVTKEDKVIGFVQPSGYIMAEVKEGDYQFWAKTEAKNEVDLKIEKNKIYCIENYITMGFFVGHPQFKLIPLEKCETEIKTTKLTIQE